MTQKTLDMIKQLEKTIEFIADEDIAKNVMEGMESLKLSTNKSKVATWVKSVIDKLDQNVDEPKCIEIMEACGLNCANVNHQAIDKFKKRYQKYPTLDEFLDAEEKQPMAGTKLKREGSAIIHIYAPQSFTRPMRCFCNLVNGLPENITMSRTYCNCSKALVKKMWEEATGKPVNVELLQSALAGASECHFKITF